LRHNYSDTIVFCSEWDLHPRDRRAPRWPSDHGAMPSDHGAMAIARRARVSPPSRSPYETPARSALGPDTEWPPGPHLGHLGAVGGSS